MDTKNEFSVFESLDAPKPIGCYSQIVGSKSGSQTFYLSGQIPLNPRTGNIDSNNIKDQALQVFKNIDAVLSAAGLTKSNVIKTTCFIKNIDDFGIVNEVYEEFFVDVKIKPARSLVEVARLPKDVLIEIETIAAK